MLPLCGAITQVGKGIQENAVLQTTSRKLQQTLPSPLACVWFICGFVSAPHFSPQVIKPAVGSVISCPFPVFNNSSLINVVSAWFLHFIYIKSDSTPTCIRSNFTTNSQMYKRLVFTQNFMITSAITFVELFWSHSIGLGICSSPKSWGTNGIFVESLKLRQSVSSLWNGKWPQVGEGQNHKHRDPEQNLTPNQWFNTNVGKVSRINIASHCLMLYISLTGHLNSNSLFLS